MAQTKDEERANGAWIRQLSDAHERALIQLSELETSHANPRSVFAKRQSHRNLHAAVLNYYDLLRPYRSEVDADLWEKRSHTVRNTEIGDVELRLGRADDGEEYSLSNEWRMRYETELVESEDHMEGRKQEAREQRIFLPPAGARVVYGWLNDALYNLGFAAEPKQTVPTYGFLEVEDEDGMEVEQ
jgi:hypothetical protein